MSKRVTLRVRMELLSDTVFGAGFSIPGGEDISVCRDAEGWPYLKGSTFKGLLRESAENWLVWTGGAEADLAAVFGEGGWDGTDDGRRLHLTELRLANRPAGAEDCFAERAFTSMENGTAKDGTLRLARCIVSGLAFEGTLSCLEADAEFVKNALAAIKWVGTMRSRGFGRVRVTCEAAKSDRTLPSVSDAHCIRYRLHTESPVLVTDLSRSSGNSFETYGCIPGSAIRGMIVSELSAEAGEWFDKNRIALLADKTRFLDAFPLRGDYAPIPSPKGFYEDKQETGDIENVLRTGGVKAGQKRAKLGSFCAVDGNMLRCWSASSGGATRIARGAGDKDTEMFQTRHLGAGQDFEGYILLDDASLSEKVSGCLADTVWLGADRYGGFGKCSVTALEALDAPKYIGAYGVKSQGELSETIYMLALSPLSMLDEYGETCGIDEDKLTTLLGVGEVEIELCATTTVEYGGYNRTWRCRVPVSQMYDRGSVFKLRCDRAPELSALRRLEAEGLGVRRAEGFGQVLFLSKERYERIDKKETGKRAEKKADSTAAAIRRARYEWVMKNAPKVARSKASKSQIGTIQALCEKALALGGNWGELKAHLDKNLNDRGAKHRARFEKINELVTGVMERPLSETLDASCEDTNEEKLRLLILLFDHSRKEGV